ncbi:MAG: DNA translocase FtsK [Clostridiales bacterium]|nr:DNA translocase FtsK [Clostridiales bacterium]
MAGTQTKKKKKQTKKPSRTARPAGNNKRGNREVKKDGLLYQCIPFILLVVALFVEICLLLPDKLGLLGAGISGLFFGLFSVTAYLLPVFLAVIAAYFRRIDKSIWCKVVYASICLVMAGALFHAFSGVSDTLNPVTLFKAGMEKKGGGAVGGLVGGLLLVLARRTGTAILSIACILLFGLLLFDLTPHHLWMILKERAIERKELAQERNAAARAENPSGQKFSFRVQQPASGSGSVRASFQKKKEGARRPGSRRIIEENERIVEELSAAHAESMPAEPEMAEETPNVVERTGDSLEGEINLDAIFADEDPFVSSESDTASDEAAQDQSALQEEDASPSQALQEEEEELLLAREPVGTKEPEEKKEYIFPPLSLLKNPPQRVAAVGEEEAKANAVKLVKTLASFRVNTKISNISRGPTITRYELVPEEGVRVRSVANLVDDISLSLATEGVRIEAPIPGKSAIGIEVPNKNVETVYLRELIDHDTFRSAGSRLTAALGMDVAGAPRYFDIAKMPHLLIAGATGMGKSVCINSILTSLLYRASPEECKLILIDPKKVELNIYNGLPHLLVPVVSHPKKAAGTLNWACIEMERRFEMIEEVGVRDINGYNEVVAREPEREYLPKIVIIIDELADLMMTAPDDVENSICRLAQKARAAGMHLIIGTQRPSVDVITGLIKANIPSRIAFTVASQVDSRTILDIAGAEKLIGRGDMLFAPVGSSKPMRIQGSFVSDQEVDAVVEFIKRQSGDTGYDQEVASLIEKEAERCGTKKGAGGAASADGGGEDDPRLMEALEVALDNGKISTSLLQRRMSIGYGKAAKLIDQLEAKGFVGPLEGSKPREIRITKQEYMEMMVNREEE